jgi:hypothetical protein
VISGAPRLDTVIEARASALRRVPVVLLVVAYAGAVALLAARSLSWPLIHDAPILHYIAWRIAEGAVPYRDLFDMNFAGTYLIHLAALEGFGPGDAAWRAFDLAWLACTSLALAAFARPWGVAAAVGSGLFFALYHLAGGAWQAGQRDFFLAIFLVLGALGVARWTASGGRPNLAWAGLAMGAGITIKPHVALLAVAFAALVLAVGIRSGSGATVSTAVFLVSLLAIPLAVLAWIAAAGGLPAWRDIVWHYLVPYYARLGRARPWAFHRWQVWIAVAAAVVLALLHGFRARPYTARHAIATLGLAYGVVHYLGQGKGWAYHLYPLAAFAGLLAFSELRSALTRRPLVGAPLLASLAAVLVLLVQGGSEASQAAWIGEKRDVVETLAADLGPLAAEDSVQVLDTTDGGMHALLLLRGRQPTRFVYDFHFFHDEEAAEIRALRRELMGGLAARPPRYIVLFRRGWPEGGAERVARFPDLRRHLDERYRVVRERPAYIVYEKRRDT